MEPGECPEALRLLDQYIAALDVYHRRVGGFILSQVPELLAARAQTDLAFGMLSVARRKYWAHIKAHGCRRDS